MKKATALLLALLTILTLAACAPATEVPEPTPSAAPAPTEAPEPTPTPRPSIEETVIPECKSPKWQEYDRIIFSLFHHPEVEEYFAEENASSPAKGELIYNYDITETENVFCGVYPFTEQTNGFLYTSTDLKPEDMVYVEILISNQAIKAEIDKLMEKYDAQNPIPTISDLAHKYGSTSLNYAQKKAGYIEEYTKEYFQNKNMEYLRAMAANQCFYAKYNKEVIEPAYKADIQPYLERYDKSWEKKYGDLSAKEEYDSKTAAEAARKEYMEKANYSLFLDEIEYYQEKGYDLYYEDLEDIYTPNGVIKLCGFLSVEEIMNRSFECYDENAQYSMSFAMDFPAKYEVATEEDITVTAEDVHSYVNYQRYTTFLPADKIERYDGDYLV